MTEKSMLLFKDLLALMRVSKATLYRSVFTNPTFPKPFKIGVKRNAWLRADVEAWIQAQATAANGGAA